MPASKQVSGARAVYVVAAELSAGEVDPHGLQRLAVHVEGLLAEVVDAGAEVLQGGGRIEVTELEPLGRDRRAIWSRQSL